MVPELLALRDESAPLVEGLGGDVASLGSDRHRSHPLLPKPIERMPHQLLPNTSLPGFWGDAHQPNVPPLIPIRRQVACNVADRHSGKLTDEHAVGKAGTTFSDPARVKHLALRARELEVEEESCIAVAHRGNLLQGDNIGGSARTNSKPRRVWRRCQRVLA